MCSDAFRALVVQFNATGVDFKSLVACLCFPILSTVCGSLSQCCALLSDLEPTLQIRTKLSALAAIMARARNYGVAALPMPVQE